MENLISSSEVQEISRKEFEKAKSNKKYHKKTKDIEVFEDILLHEDAGVFGYTYFENSYESYETTGYETFVFEFKGKYYRYFYGW